jgi:Transposase DDE domain group 1/Winged helix-turn helix
LVDHFIASYAEPPAAIVLDLDHSDDPTYGKQELAFYNHHYQNHCYLPLFIFEGTSHALVTAFLASGHPPAWGRKCDDRGPAVVVSPAPLADVITAGPLAAGSPSGCWHPPRMHDLIQRRFGGSYHPHSLAPLLHHLGFSSQKARLVSEHLNPDFPLSLQVPA